MNQVEVAVIGTGWCGGIRAETLARSALVDKLHICEIRPDRLAEVKALTAPASATLDYQDIIKNPNISVVYVCTTPEQNHYPITRDCLKAGKHVLLEKPIAMELWEADELITLARRGRLKFTIGYSQRFNPKFAYAKKSITAGTLGKVVSVMVSRHLSRGLGTKIAKRVKLSPVVMESTHDLDFVFWLLEPAKPVRVYSQGAYGYMQPINGSYDIMWSIVTMDNGAMVTVGGGWNLPPSYPNFCSTWIEILGTDGALEALGLVALADDKGAQIVYAPAPVVRETVLEQHPEIRTTLDPVFQSLTLQTLQRLNAEIAVDGQEAKTVAVSYLKSNHFLP